MKTWTVDIEKTLQASVTVVTDGKEPTNEQIAREVDHETVWDEGNWDVIDIQESD